MTTETAGDGDAPVKILVNFSIDDDDRRAIQAVSPRVRLSLSMERETPDARPPGGGAGAAPGWRRVDDAALAPLLAEAEVWFTFRFPVEWLDRAPRLRWVQLSSAGADHMIREGIFERRPDIQLTTASGIHAIPISEQVIGYILAFSRDFLQAMQAQREHRWTRYQPDEAAGKTLGIVGYGPVGRRTAELAHALGMRVWVLRHSGQSEPAEAVERFLGPRDLPALLAASDFVLLAAPLTPGTRGMIDAQALGAMREDAVLINIARGALVDESALIAALQRGRIGGAALDVFAQEPLPAESLLWSLPNVLITPHVAGANPHYSHRATALFCRNLGHYLAGRPLLNLVDPARGY